MQMDERAAVKYLAAHGKKKVAGVKWQCDFETALILVGAWQLALRNPQFGESDTGQHCRRFCEAMIELLADGDEIVRGLLWRGFDAAFDTQRPLPTSPVVIDGKFLGEESFRVALNDAQQMMEVLAQLKSELDQGWALPEAFKFAIASFVMGVFYPEKRAAQSPPNPES